MMMQANDRVSRPERERGGLRPDEGSYRFLLENSGDILWTIDLDGTWQFMTNNVYKAIHIRADDIIGKAVWDFVAPEYHAILKDKLKKRLQGEQIPAYEVEVIDSEGRRVPFEVLTTPIVDRNGKIIGIQGISRDITQRKRAEEAVRRAYDELERRVEERTEELVKARATLQGILDTVPIGIVVADARTMEITFYSRGAERIFGGPVTGTAYGPSEATYQLLRPDGSPYPTDELPLTLSINQGLSVVNAELMVQRADGGRYIVMVSSAPIKGPQGRITAAVASIVDITRLKKAENELRDAKAQAELYVDLMSHDINNMNQVGIGYLEMALGVPGIAPGERQYLEKTLEVLQNSSKLIENVRMLQRVRRHELRYEPVQVCDLLAEVRSGYAGVPGKPVIISIDSVCQCTVSANALLKDVFSNIVGNAIKHAQGPVTIGISAGLIFEDGRKYCKISIEDDGPGIPDGLKERLFTRLQRGATRAYGRGLGLYLVKVLVDDFKGRVWVEDRVPGDPARGSRFVVVLPAA
jgi:PAS domain S-box-containing protein